MLLEMFHSFKDLNYRKILETLSCNRMLLVPQYHSLKLPPSVVAKKV